jgi:hypothetical protein
MSEVAGAIPALCLRCTILGEDGNTFNGGDLTHAGIFFDSR